LAAVPPEPPAARHRLAGVDYEIDQDLLDLPGDHRDYRPGMVAPVHLHAVFAQVLLGQEQDLLDQAYEVDVLAAVGLVAGEPEHAADDRRRPLSALQDLLERLLLCRVRGPFEAELGVV